jgi:hypothetical protein
MEGLATGWGASSGGAEVCSAAPPSSPCLPARLCADCGSAARRLCSALNSAVWKSRESFAACGIRDWRGPRPPPPSSKSRELRAAPMCQCPCARAATWTQAAPLAGPFSGFHSHVYCCYICCILYSPLHIHTAQSKIRHAFAPRRPAAAPRHAQSALLPNLLHKAGG